MIRTKHYVKSFRIRSYSSPYFPAFGLNTERYGVSLYIQSECRKMRIRVTPNTDTFRAVKSIKSKCLPDICPLLMKLFLFTFRTGIDQIIFFEEYLWGILLQLQLTFIWHKIEIKIYVLQLALAIKKLFGKIYYKIKKIFKKFLISLQILVCKL